MGVEDETFAKAKVGDRVRPFADLTERFMEVIFVANRIVKIKVRIDSEKLRKIF